MKLIALLGAAEIDSIAPRPDAEDLASMVSKLLSLCTRRLESPMYNSGTIPVKPLMAFLYRFPNQPPLTTSTRPGPR
jgi:hypothetical protein